MDTEQQIRLNFLDEAEEYFDRMESNLLDLSHKEIDARQVDLVLRLAHSIKGGAAMMNFNTLSKVAHRLEDFLKILRVRYGSARIATEVETLLLQSVDLLRNVSKLNRQGIEVTEDTISDRYVPIFNRLQEHLGELEAADEDALMSQDEDVDPALLLFEEGVDTVLDRFESQLQQLEISELAEELVSTAEELIGFGNMANLEPFIQLCESIQQQATNLGLEEITSLAKEALKTWKRSHALVLRGSTEKLPCYLKGFESVNRDSDNAALNPSEEFDLTSLQSAFEEPETDFSSTQEEFDLNSLQSAFEEEPETDFSSSEEEEFDLTSLQSAFEEPETDFNPTQEEFDLTSLQSAFEEPETDFSSTQEEFDLTSLQSAFEEEPETDFSPSEEEEFDLTSLQSAFEEEPETDFNPSEEEFDLTSLQSAFEEEPEAIQTTVNSPKIKSVSSIQSIDKMVRVPASQLKQFNNLFEQLILERNTINAQMQQFQNIISLMSERMSQMERSNVRLKQWYDRASIEGLLSSQEQKKALVTSTTDNNPTRKSKQNRFDSLEMDRYSDVHLICQEQIETIVQLQEVATDIELGLQEINQTVSNLNYTTKSMQGNVTRTQMLPFAEVVKRFPRVIRDLNLQFDKQVELKIVGENTLLDRSVVETLSDPLMHLLRNSFDHGIEDKETRITQGKSATGTITIQANNRGTHTVITVSDDGGGISIDKIRDRIIGLGMSQEEVAQIPEADLLNFIFEPGFSTAQQVTELSGRGVGMDVVRTNIETVGGDIAVATEPGNGTTFTLRIPFSLSILKVAIVQQRGFVFAIGANTIRELLPQDSATINIHNGDRFLVWNQGEIPLIEAEKTLIYNRSGHNFKLPGNPAIDRPMALVVGENETHAALQISRFWQEQESTIRPIDSLIPLPSGIVSSVIIGDGKVVPVVDPMLLIEECLRQQNNKTQIEQSISDNNYSTTKTILIVDDSINVRRYLSLTLEKAGYKVEEAKDGREAVDRLLGGLSVNAVICDIEMPILDGYGVLEEIRERSEFAYLPIAMLTSRSNEKHRKLAMNLGASAYFSKPYNEQELLDRLNELLVQAELLIQNN